MTISDISEIPPAPKPLSPLEAELCRQIILYLPEVIIIVQRQKQSTVALYNILKLAKDFARWRIAPEPVPMHFLPKERPQRKRRKIITKITEDASKEADRFMEALEADYSRKHSEVTK